ncbi:DegT/DnrJ/EryC1/StrS family aminotransferase [Gelidibacter sp. F2691]|nr:DegT/DnrJ/EryC1/StrS family aminotransferase [Gelidibacter sp. F2691]
MINVTSPFLPPKEEYIAYIDKIYDKNWLTNMGPLASDLELKLKEHLNLDYLLFLSNGTIALQIAIKALELKGDIITTPFSYVATTSSIVWENCNPVFADIDPHTLNIDPKKIEAVINENTTAILATHVFGNPCDIDAIEAIAKKHNLKIIYDAAHCYGVNYKSKSVLSYGDVSTISFHATKIFHTVEGGAVVTYSKDIDYKMSKLRNFGHKTSESFDGVGINGKNSEFHAAMGLCNLKYIDTILSKRKEQYIYYHKKLKGQKVSFQKITEHTDYNYSYFPVVFDSEETLLKVKEELQNNWISARRYFYPSLSTLSYVVGEGTPIADKISKSILCLPIYHTLTLEEQDFICGIIIKTLKS